MKSKGVRRGQAGYTLGDDQPKDNPWQDDRLGYAPFAERIFNTLRDHRAPNGYVIGLHGPWGSGKSTILNFIKAHLRKHNEEAPESKIELIEFQPWIVSGHQDLIVAYFKLLSEALGPKDGRWKRGFLRVLRLTDGTTDKLVDAAATVALTVDPSGGVVSGFAGGVAKNSVNSLIGRFVQEKSLQQAYEELKVRLSASGRNFVVMIDDIDRLEDEEVRLIMQMVKTVGRLPNVVYLLSYDRRIISKILDQRAFEAEPRFTEKIVQQEISLPPPDKSALLAMLDVEIRFLDDIPNDERWWRILQPGVHRWIQRPRDVLRLTNAVKWSWPALAGDFDGADLLTMEGIRLFDPLAFEWIQRNRDFLFHEGRYVMSSDEDRKANVEALKARLPTGTVEPILDLLSLLFPEQSKWFGATYGYQETHVAAHNRRGISSPAHYDSYFALQLSSDVIPAATVDQLMTGENPNLLVGVIKPYLSAKTTAGKQMIAVLLRELRYRLEGGQAVIPHKALFDALLEIGEPIASMPWPGGMFEVTPGAVLDWLLKDILTKWPPETANLNLLASLSGTVSLGMFADVYLIIARAKGKIGKDGKGLEFLTDETVSMIESMLLNRIHSAQETDELVETTLAGDVLRAWKVLEGPEKPREWITKFVGKSWKLAARVGRAIMSEQVSAEGRRFRVYDEVDQTLFDLSAMVEAAVLQIGNAPSDADEHRVLAELIRGGPLVLAGQSADEDF